jgi:hypothetical protein
MTRRTRLPKPDRQRALALLTSCPDGCSEAVMVAHGFSIEQMVELVQARPRARDGRVRTITAIALGRQRAAAAAGANGDRARRVDLPAQR